MIGPVRSLRLIFGTPRGLRTYAAGVLAAFGLASAAVQFVGQLFPSVVTEAGLITFVTLFLCLLWGIAQTYPRHSLRREFPRPHVSITIMTGDLFEQDAHIVVGFTDTFDTSTQNDRVISENS